MPRREPEDRKTGDALLLRFDDLRRAERGAISGEVAATIAHMIGTPLHVIAGRASLIRSAPDDPSVADNARRIEDQVQRLAERLRGLADYLIPPSASVSTEPLGEVVELALALYSPVGQERGVRFELANGASAETPVAGSSVLGVLTSLLSLATRVAASGSTCPLDVRLTDEGRVAFLLEVPGLEPISTRLDSLEPGGESSLPREELQLLLLCGVLARRKGGTLEVVGGAPGKASIRYVTGRPS